MMQPPPAPGPRSRPSGPRLLTSLIVMGVGLVIGIASVVAIVIPLAGTFTSPVYSVPYTFGMHLHDARYTVYQHTQTRSVFGSVTPDSPLVPILPAAVQVTAPDGSRVAVSPDSDNETITRGTSVYRGSLVFHAPADGDYTLVFSNAVPTNVIVSRSILDALRGVFVWFGIGALGGFLAIAGTVMLIVGATRRGRAKRAMYGGWGSPPGQWGSPPQQWGPPPPPGPPPQWGPPPTR